MDLLVPPTATVPPLPEPRPRDFAARLKRGDSSRPLVRQRRRMHAGRRLAVLGVAIAVPAMAQGNLGKTDRDVPHTAAVVPMGFETPGESFPGSAFYYLQEEPHVAPPRPLPAMDLGTAAAPAALALPQAQGSILDPGPAARALRLAGTMTDRNRAQYCLTMAIYYEAASEADAGQRAVAQVVLNRVAHPAYPNTVCGVVFQGSERTTGCQFTFTCDGSLARKPARMWWDRAARIAAEALGGTVYEPVGLATHYHTVQVNPYWASSLDHVGTIGAHRFYRWRGLAGRPQAFTDRYRGGEPVAAPHPRLAAAEPAPAAEADPLALARVYEASLAEARKAAGAAPAVVPAYSAEVQARGGEALFKAEGVPASGAVREEFARSGRWLAQP